MNTRPSNGSSGIKTLAEAEKDCVINALRETKWKKTDAVKILGITRPTLDEKIKDYGLEAYKV